MMGKKILFIVVCLCIFQCAFSQEAWTLRSLVEYALTNNISVKQADIQSRLTALTLRQSRQMQYPSASVSGSVGVNAGRSIDPTTNLFTNTQLLSTGFSLSSAMTVFNFFSIKNNIEGNRYDLEASRANIEKIKNDIAVNVATAYLLALVAEEQEKIAGVAVRQTLQNLENTRKRVDAGALPELNLAELEAQLAR
ncbi:MAG: TolC family protein, partial [Chitinophagaceae bacterium]|nr:TolC family protein [Chitinophagaceae bacterium]